MGADYTAKAAIGLNFDPAVFFKPRKVKAFEHSFPESQKFCPDTGRKLWTTVSDCAEVYKNEEYPPYIEVNGRKYTVYKGGDQSDCEIACLLGVDDTYSNGGNTEAMALIPDDFDLKQQRAQMKADLEPLGIWNDSEFGLWTVLYCSC